MRIDVHSHVILPGMLGHAGRYGPEVKIADGKFVMRVGEHVSTVRVDDKTATMGHDPAGALSFMNDAPTRLAEMDRLGIDMMGVTISPLFYLYWAEPEIGVPFSRALNDALAEYCGDGDGRLFFMATLPMQDAAAAVEEMDRAVIELGARAINIAGSNLGGRELDDEAFRPIFARAETLGVTMFIHPYPEHLAGDSAIPDDYNLSWVAGYPYQEMVAVCRLVLGGVLDDVPRLKVCVTHGGGFLPYQWGRLVKFAPFMPGVKAKKPLDDYLGNFYFDALLHDPRARRFLIEFAGADHVVYGSNFGSPQDQADFGFVEDLGLPVDEVDLLRATTAIELFGLTPARRPEGSSPSVHA